MTKVVQLHLKAFCTNKPNNTIISNIIIVIISTTLKGVHGNSTLSSWPLSSAATEGWKKILCIVIFSIITISISISIQHIVIAIIIIITIIGCQILRVRKKDLLQGNVIL